LEVERLLASAIPGWDAPNQAASRAFGDQWLAEARTAVLLVPSLVTQGREHNVLLNPAHSRFDRIAHSLPEPVAWDGRLIPG
jgi:RES domain-containing protein